MEIEHLQMIIDAMRDATEGAFYLAVLWIGKSYASGIAWFFIAIVALKSVRTVSKTLSDGSVEKTRNRDESAKEKSACVQAFFAMLRSDPAYDPKGYQSDYIHDSDLQRIHKIYAEGCASIKASEEAK